MSDVLRNLMSDLLACPALTTHASTDSDEYWFRVDDRFDVCASWVNDERSVQLSALLRAPQNAPAMPVPEVEHPDWQSSGTQHDDWRHLLLWHAPTSTVMALSRASVQALDAVAFPAFVQAFNDRLSVLDQVFDGELDADGV